MKKLFLILTAIALMTWASPAMGQSSYYGQSCQFYNIEKTVKAKLCEDEDTVLQRNYIKVMWPILLNGKECPKLQEALCFWLTGKEDIKPVDKIIEHVLFTDNEGVPYGDKDYFSIIGEFDEEPFGLFSTSISTIDLKTIGKRFAVFHLFYNTYYAGAAHGVFGHNYLTYDTELDKVVKLEDIVINPEIIRPYILPSIDTHYGYTPENLFLPDSELPPIPEVFYIENGQLHLFYQVYEIAGFAYGYIDVPIEYPSEERIPDFLTPYGKILMEELCELEIY